MRGHIRERSPGHWAIVVDARDPETGKRKRKWHSFKGTKREAQVECARLIGEHKAGKVNLAPNKTMVAEYLARWLDYVQAQLGARSRERYTDLVNKNIVPLIGGIALTKLQPAMISDAYAKALKTGRRDGKGGLSPKTVLYMHRVLRHALADAVRWELLGRNPADAIRPPKTERKEMTALDSDATVALIERAKDTNLFIIILLAALCGLRRGEIVALRWRAIDLERRTLAVVVSIEQTSNTVREKPPKNSKGRFVALPSLVVDELRRYRVRQAEQLLKLGVRLTDDHHVVMQEDGLPLQPRSVTHAFQIFVRRHNLRRARLHDLRHTHATQLLKNGVHPKIAQECLGHSSIAITLDLYSHVLPNMQNEAAEGVDQALRAAMDQVEKSKG
jgi:integrase